MKTEVIETVEAKRFKPFTVAVTFETAAEARALRAIYGGSETGHLQGILDNSSYKDGVTVALMNKVLKDISGPVRSELEKQGELY